MSGHHEGAIQLILFYDPESDWTVLPFLVNGSYLLSEWHWKNWLDGCKKASTTFIKIWTPDSFSNALSGLEVIISVVPAARQPGCLPFIPGNVAFLLPLPSSPPSAGPKDVSHFFYLHLQTGEVIEYCACLHCWLIAFSYKLKSLEVWYLW